MKKIFFFAAIAALALSSCSSDELVQVEQPVEDGAVTFSAYAGRANREAANKLNFTEIAGVANAGGFGVFAYEQGRSSFSTFSASTSYPNFMYNQNVWAATDAAGTTKKDVGTSPYDEGANVVAWGYSPIKYYSNNEGAKHSFFAYAPFRGDGVTPVFSLGKAPQIRYNVRENYDLLWATPVLDKEKAGITEKINFDFQHALSKVTFHVAPFIDDVHNSHTAGTIGTTTLAKFTKVTVKSIRFVGNVPSQALLDLQTGKWTIENTQEGEYLVNVENFNWDATSSEEEISSYKTSPETPTVENTDFIKVIPSTGVKIEIVYDVDTQYDNTDATQTSANNSHVTNTVVSKEVFNLEGGKAYDFYLDLGLTSVKFDAAFTDWTSETGQTVDLPNNHNFHPLGSVYSLNATPKACPADVEESTTHTSSHAYVFDANKLYSGSNGEVVTVIGYYCTGTGVIYEVTADDGTCNKTETNAVFYTTDGGTTYYKFVDGSVATPIALISLTPRSDGKVQKTNGEWETPTTTDIYSVGSFLYQWKN